MNGGAEDRTSRSLSSCSYAADLCKEVSRRGLDDLQRDKKMSALFMVCEEKENRLYSMFVADSVSNGYEGDSGM